MGDFRTTKVCAAESGPHFSVTKPPSTLTVTFHQEKAPPLPPSSSLLTSISHIYTAQLPTISCRQLLGPLQSTHVYRTETLFWFRYRCSLIDWTDCKSLKSQLSVFMLSQLFAIKIKSLQCLHHSTVSPASVLFQFLLCPVLDVFVLNIQFGLHSSLLLSSDASGISHSELMHTAPDL